MTISGTDSGTFNFKVCYVSEHKICLIQNQLVHNTKETRATQINYTWNWSMKLYGKTYRSSDSGQSVAKLPTMREINELCHDPINIGDGFPASSSYLLDGTYYTRCIGGNSGSAGASYSAVRAGLYKNNIATGVLASTVHDTDPKSISSTNTHIAGSAPTYNGTVYKTYPCVFIHVNI